MKIQKAMRDLLQLNPETAASNKDKETDSAIDHASNMEEAG